ncbi:AMP-binding protein [Kineobactrum salinum]|uniref:AMP-binding protein n=1 Tax=Kineobactrum salinum TaxID=2708301 RepID=A0A6C0U3X5_9GAMM|nr:AMP-binding protein [Kineobactrum salinum]QIB66811.1 AMP-binding protein [Kineobactrum salinum]
MTLISSIAALRHWVEQDPNRPALTDDERTLSRGELEKRTNKVARILGKHGVKEGSFVTIVLPNCAAFIETTIAVLKLGATPQPVSSRLPKRELDAIIELAKPALIVGVVASDYPGSQVLEANFSVPRDISEEPLPERVSRYWKAPTSGGSTGRPKLIVSNVAAQVDNEFVPFSLPMMLPKAGVILVPGPLYHNAPFTLVMHGLFQGNHVVIENRFDALRTLDLIERYEVQMVLMVPTMLSRIWKLPREKREGVNISSLKLVYHMGSHCPSWLKEAWIEWLGPERVYELYGGTEMQAVTVISGCEWLDHRGSVGRCLMGEMKIVGETGEELPPGEVGDIYMRPGADLPPTYFYVGAEAKNVDGWDTIGDIGWFDKDGYLYLADRRTDMIVRGGANIYPAEVEAAIEEHPSVRSCAVVGLPDEDLGQRVHAIIQAGDGVTEAELAVYLAARLAKYKLPQSYEFVSEPLRDDAGKTRRSALRDARISTLGTF